MAAKRPFVEGYLPDHLATWSGSRRWRNCRRCRLVNRNQDLHAHRQRWESAAIERQLGRYAQAGGNGLESEFSSHGYRLFAIALPLLRRAERGRGNRRRRSRRRSESARLQILRCSLFAVRAFRSRRAFRLIRCSNSVRIRANWATIRKVCEWPSPDDHYCPFMARSSLSRPGPRAILSGSWRSPKADMLDRKGRTRPQSVPSLTAHFKFMQLA
jgi:hypothetical protein